jgi:hypothetical protein
MRYKLVPKDGDQSDSPDTPNLNSKWYLFNDFLITPRPFYEVVQFQSLWKVRN